MDPMEFKEYAKFSIESKDLKMLRESLCLAQTALCDRWPGKIDIHLDNLQKVIDEIDKNRPLASNGKHGNLHTPTCGCEDK